MLIPTAFRITGFLSTFAGECSSFLSSFVVEWNWPARYAGSWFFGLHTYCQGNVCVSKHITAYQHIKAYQGISRHINAYQRLSKHINNIKDYQCIKHVEAYQSVSKHIKTYRSILLASLPNIQFMSQFWPYFIQIYPNCVLMLDRYMPVGGDTRSWSCGSWLMEILAWNSSKERTVAGPPIDPFGSAPKWGTPKWMVSNGISFDIDDLEAPPWWETSISWKPYKLKRGSPLQLMANVDMDARHNTSLSCPNTQHVSFFAMISLTLFPAASHVSAWCASCRVVWPESRTCLWLQLSEKPNQWNYPQCRDIRQSESFPHGSTTKFWGLVFGSFGLTPTRAGQPRDVQSLRKHDVRGPMISFSPLGKKTYRVVVLIHTMWGPRVRSWSINPMKVI